VDAGHDSNKGSNEDAAVGTIIDAGQQIQSTGAQEVATFGEIGTVQVSGTGGYENTSGSLVEVGQEGLEVLYFTRPARKLSRMTFT